ncbi:hypothetical protein [Sphingobium sp. B2]|uniref:hypothetical protein n=1 Tax=Sphingobium sp. B2 TaxID=2583228 RepID=UPI0011A6C029|nr:hypothetical protein [Sphingobium sp. B2]
MSDTPIENADAPAVEAPPSVVDINETPREALAKIRVVDAGTGTRIDKVIFADAMAGKVKRYAVENGDLVRVDDRFVIIEEDRQISIEWLGNKIRNSF